MEKESLQFIHFIGKGGCGKDTQMNLLIQKLPETTWVIPTGDVFRDALRNSGKYAGYHDLLQDCLEDVKAGGYIPDEKIKEIVEQEVVKGLSSGKNIFLFPGFPRTVTQLNLIDNMMIKLSDSYEVSSDFIYYPVSDEVTKLRSEGRNKEAAENGLPPRDEDAPESVDRKLDFFRKFTKPLIQRLSIEDRLIIINAERTVPEIEAETSQILSKERV